MMHHHFHVQLWYCWWSMTIRNILKLFLVAPNIGVNIEAMMVEVHRDSGSVWKQHWEVQIFKVLLNQPTTIGRSCEDKKGHQTSDGGSIEVEYLPGVAGRRPKGWPRPHWQGGEESGGEGAEVFCSFKIVKKNYRGSEIPTPHSPFCLIRLRRTTRHSMIQRRFYLRRRVFFQTVVLC